MLRGAGAVKKAEAISTSTTPRVERTLGGMTQPMRESAVASKGSAGPARRPVLQTKVRRKTSHEKVH